MTRRCWTPLGPACVLTQKGAIVSGRFTSIVIDPSDASGNTVIAGSAGGTLWKTSDAGVTWSMLDAQPLAGLSISALAAHATPEGTLLVVGTGELYKKIGLAGDGVRVRKPDGTWELRVRDPHQDPTYDPVANPVHRLHHSAVLAIAVEVAAGGIILYAGTAAGLYSSGNRGFTWQRLGESGLYFSLVNANGTILGALQSDGVYALETPVRRLDTGLPVADDLADSTKPRELGKIVLAVAPSNQQIVYALYTTNESRVDRLFRSLDHGETWAPREFRHGEGTILFGDKTLQLVVHPADPARIYAVVDGAIHRSLDGGANWEPVELGDMVPIALAFSPVPPFPAWLATENGIYVALTEGTRASGTRAQWEPRNRGLFALQVHSLAQHPTERSILLAATPDFGPIRHRSHPLWKTADPDAPSASFMPTFHVAVDPNRPTYWYATARHPFVSRSKDGGATWRHLQPGIAPEDDASQTPPIAIDPRHTGVVYYGSTRLYRWDEAHVSAGWVEIARFEKPIVAIAHAAPFPPDWTPSDQPVDEDPPPVPTQWIYVATATDVFRVEELAGVFTTTGPFRPHYFVAAGAIADPPTAVDGFQDRISSLRTDPDDPEGVYVTVGGAPLAFRANARNGTTFSAKQLATRPALAARVWGSGTGGRHWSNIELLFTPEELGKVGSGLHEQLESTLPTDVSVYKILVDPEVRDRVFLATDRGVIVSSNDTLNRWNDFTDNMPRVPIADLAIFPPSKRPATAPDTPLVPRVLRAATFGAGVWERVLDEEPGPCAGYDFFLRDNLLDTGEAATLDRQPDPIVLDQPRTVLDAIDLKIDRRPFRQQTDFIGFEHAVHEAPQAGVEAHVYLQVHNRGPSSGSVRVRVLYTTRHDDAPPRHPTGTFPPEGLEGWRAVGDVQEVVVQPGVPAVVRWTNVEFVRDIANPICLLAYVWSPLEPITFPFQPITDTAATDKRVSLSTINVIPPQRRGWFRWWMIPVALGAVVLVLDAADVQHADLGLI